MGNLQAPKSIVIKGGRIIDPLTSRDEITDIYIVNDEIMTIDVGLSQQIPDVEIIDATGLIVVPGFIDFHIYNFHWFVFNIADIFITLGVICLIVAEIFFNKNKINE